MCTMISRVRWENVLKKNVHVTFPMRKKHHPCTMRARFPYDDHCVRWENVLKKNVRVTFPMRKKHHPCTMRARWLYDDDCARWKNVQKKNLRATFPIWKKMKCARYVHDDFCTRWESVHVSWTLVQLYSYPAYNTQKLLWTPRGAAHTFSGSQNTTKKCWQIRQ